MSASARIVAAIRSFGTSRDRTAVGVADPAAPSALSGSGAPAIGRRSAAFPPRLLAAAAVALLALALPAAASAATPPTISSLVVSELTTASAHFSAEVDPGGATAEFDTAWHFECTPSCSGLTAGTVSGAAAEVEADASALQPATFYTVRLLASNAGGQRKATATFTTPGAAPLVKAWAAGPIAPTTADINAQIDPQGSATSYWFEWGSADCAVATCTSIPPLHEAFAGSGSTYTYVFRHLTGLAPNTTYHFRLVAKNASGITEGPDRTFTTAAAEPACANAGMPGTGTLPDCRGYEMVSPPDKNGADVILQSYKTFAAEVGDGVSYPTIGAFGDVRGTSTDVQYLARRTAAPATNGWSNHAITPAGGAPTLLPLFFSNVPSFEFAFTPDLSGAIYKSWRPLTDAPGGANVADVTNLYRIRDLDAGEPQPQLLTDSAKPLQPAGSLAGSPSEDQILKLVLINALDAASKDLSHVLFQSPWNLTTDGGFAGYPGNLYEYADGIGVRAVGRIPVAPATECDDSSGPSCTDAPGAQAGFTASIFSSGGSLYSDGMISDDGSRILFQTPSGVSYLRENGTRTYELNGQAWAMSADGSRVFLTTGEGLVMYDLTAPAGNRLTLVSVPGAGETFNVRGVVGTSADGHYVYFTSGGQLVPGEPAGVHRGLYMWHDGTIAYIGRFADETEMARNELGKDWGFFTFTRSSRVTPDGRFLLFTVNYDEGFRGRGGYAGYDHGSCDYGEAFPCRELFLYSAESGKLTCVSCNPAGVHDEAPSGALLDVHAGASASVPTSHFSYALSDDGRYVFFSTAEKLLEEDTNSKWDAYEYDAQTGELHLISSGTDPADSYYLDSSPDGRDVFFATRQQLVGWDIDKNYDLYDARVGGGFPEPVPVPAACQGESCHLGARATPPAPPVASQSPGPGNPRPACPKGRVRRHGKCVKKTKPKKHHGKKTSHNRGGNK